MFDMNQPAQSLFRAHCHNVIDDELNRNDNVSSAEIKRKSGTYHWCILDIRYAVARCEICNTVTEFRVLHIITAEVILKKLYLWAVIGQLELIYEAQIALWGGHREAVLWDSTISWWVSVTLHLNEERYRVEWFKVFLIFCFLRHFCVSILCHRYAYV